MFKYNMGGSVPRETNIAGQRHSLAYINPFEEDLLNTQYRGGEGQPVPPFAGPGGVPAYPSVDDGYGNKKTTEERVVKVSAPKTTPNKVGSGKDERVAAAQKQLADSLKAANLASVSGKPLPMSYDEAVTAGATPGAGGTGMYDPVTQTGYSNTAGQGLGSTFTLSGNKDDRGNVTGTTFTNAKDIINTGPGPTGMMKIYEDLKAAPKSLIDDLTMGYKSGLFSSRAEQEANLLAAGYTREEVYAYFARTDATIERNKNQPYVPGSGDDDNNIIQELATEVVDPCPEGYKMDPETNACMIDPDIGMGGPVFTPSDPNAAVGGGSGYTQPMGNFIPTPLQPAPMNPMQQQLNALTSALQPKQNPQMQAGLGALPRRA